MTVITSRDSDAAARQYQALSQALDSARQRVVIVLIAVTAVLYVAANYLSGALVKTAVSLRVVIALPLLLNAQAWMIWASDYLRTISRPSFDREMASRTSDIFEDLNYLRYLFDRQSRRHSWVFLICALQMAFLAFAFFYVILQTRALT